MTQIHYNTSWNKHRVTIHKKYIPKLQLHQHSLLTRKVFSRHNIYQHKSSSLYHLGHRQVFVIFKVIFIFKSSLSISHLHWIWIISRSGSSWSIITGSGSTSLDWIWIITTGSSSLDLDHHWILIITRSRSSLVLSHDSSCHRKFYRTSPFSCWL